MSEKSPQSSAAGIGFTGLLGITFIVLRLCNVIDWKWCWVLAPFWIPAAAITMVLLCALLYMVAKVK